MDVHPHGPMDVQQVLDELSERDPAACLQGLAGRVHPVLGDDRFTKQGVVIVVGVFKLVPVGRHHPLQGLPDKEDFGVGLQTVHDPLQVEAVQGLEMVAVVDCVVLDALGVGGLARQHHQSPLPVGAACFGHLAVEQLVLLLHIEVLHVVPRDGPGDAAFVLGTDVLHQFTAGFQDIGGERV